MSAQLLDGTALAAKITEDVKARVKALRDKGKKVVLNAVQVGEDPASRSYIKSQKKSCDEIGITYELRELPAEATQDELIEFLGGLNSDPRISGVILQMPLPKQIDRREVQKHIDYRKDVEGITPASLGLLLQDRPMAVPCTALGAVELLHSAVENVEGMDCTIVGRSEIVGKPIAMLLLSMSRSATVTVCHSRTKDLAAKVAAADVLFAAVGRPEIIKGEWIKEGAIVIDVGINRVPMKDEQGNPVLNKKGKKRHKTIGDVEFDTAKERASMISPVPGGVGPMTVAILLRGTVELAERAG